MNGSILSYLLPILVLLLVEGVFSGGEIALLSADKIRLRTEAKKGSSGARLALDLTSHPERILSSTLLVTSLCVIITSTLVALYFHSSETANSELVAVAITSPLIVILGELLPKAFFQRYADRMAPLAAYPVWGAFHAFYPVTRLISLYTARVSKLVTPLEQLLRGKRRTARDEIRSLLAMPSRESRLKSSEKKMIRRIIDFRDTEAKHAFIPLVKVEAIEESSTIREALERFRDHRHSRMPVYSERVDNVVGILDVADLFGISDIDAPLKPHVSAARYVPESQALDSLMREMTAEDNQIVVVVDEYGGAVGILTFEDIVEEIVGEIHDEFDPQSAPWQQVGPRAWNVLARTELLQLHEQLGLELPEGDYETLAGFLLQQFGCIPETGDELFFHTRQGQVKFTIRKASPRTIESVAMEFVGPPPETESPASGTSGG